MAWDTALAKLQYRKVCDIISSPSWQKGLWLGICSPLCQRIVLIGKASWKMFHIKVLIFWGNLIFQIWFHVSLETILAALSSLSSFLFSWDRTCINWQTCFTWYSPELEKGHTMVSCKLLVLGGRGFQNRIAHTDQVWFQ